MQRLLKLLNLAQIDIVFFKRKLLVLRLFFIYIFYEINEGRKLKLGKVNWVGSKL